MTPHLSGQKETTLLSAESIAVKIGDFEILRDVGFTLRPGEFPSVVGPSGCGKTTLLMALAGFSLATEGSVIFDGNEYATS